MRLLIALICLTFPLLSFTNELDVLKIRNLYFNAATNKDASNKLLHILNGVNEQSPAVLVAYKGAAEMLGAKYAVNPINKFSKFKTGKNLLEKAIKIDSKDLEIRFLRFTIQTNLPSFLNYSQAIEKDKIILIHNLKTLNDINFRNQIKKYLIQSKRCSVAELKILEN